MARKSGTSHMNVSEILHKKRQSLSRPPATPRLLTLVRLLITPESIKQARLVSTCWGPNETALKDPSDDHVSGSWRPSWHKHKTPDAKRIKKINSKEFKMAVLTQSSVDLLWRVKQGVSLWLVKRLPVKFSPSSSHIYNTHPVSETTDYWILTVYPLRLSYSSK